MVLTGEGVTHEECFRGLTSTHFPARHLSPQTHWVSSLVVAWDGKVRAVQMRICVTQSSAGQVDVRGLCEGAGGQPWDQAPLKAAAP